MAQSDHKQSLTSSIRRTGYAAWCEAVATPRRTGSSPELGCALRSGFALFIVAWLVATVLGPYQPAVARPLIDSLAKCLRWTNDSPLHSPPIRHVPDSDE